MLTNEQKEALIAKLEEAEVMVIRLEKKCEQQEIILGKVLPRLETAKKVHEMTTHSPAPKLDALIEVIRNLRNGELSDVDWHAFISQG